MTPSHLDKPCLVFPEEPLPLPLAHVREAIRLDHAALHAVLPHLDYWEQAGVTTVEVFQTSWKGTGTIRPIHPNLTPEFNFTLT